MNRRIRKKKLKQVLETTNSGVGVAAADWSPARAFVHWPSLNPRQEISSWAMDRIWRRARSLYANCPEVKQAVNTLRLLVGTITPQPMSGDEEWDKKARNAFISRVSNQYLFDANRRMNWESAQNWIETRAIVDGDCLTVLTTAPDGGGSIALYSAPQITGDGKYMDNRPGVITDAQGRVRGYDLFDYTTEKPKFISEYRSILYRHNPDPADPRGHSELIAAITTAEDVYEIIGYNKASIKFASMFGLVETSDVNVQTAGISDIVAARRGTIKGASEGTPQAMPVQIGGTTAITMSPGHKLETIHDSRPSNEVREFLKMLVHSIAYSVGLDPTILYNPEDMGSASVRFVISKAKDWAKERINDRILWANKIYQYILSCEVKAGRLEPCPTEHWNRVKWVSTPHWSIDLGHDTDNSIKLIDAGLMSMDDYTLSHFGKTSEEIFEENLHAKAHNIERAKAAGVNYYDIIPPKAGAAQIPQNIETEEK